jgi:tryptophan synthase beta chain
VRAAIDEARKAEGRGEKKCIQVNISGNGFLDMDAYLTKAVME